MSAAAFRLTFPCPDCGQGIDMHVVPSERVTVTHPDPVCEAAATWIGWIASGVLLRGRVGEPPPATPDDVDCNAPDDVDVLLRCDECGAESEPGETEPHRMHTHTCSHFEGP